MDLLTWLLLSWIAIAGIVFFAVQKVLEFYPPEGTEQSSGTESSSGASSPNSSYAQQSQQHLAYSGHSPSSSPHSADDATTASGFMSKFIGEGSSSVAKFISQNLPGASDGRESCDWINELISWLFKYYRSQPEFVNAWVKSLNDAAKKASNAVRIFVCFFLKFKYSIIILFKYNIIILFKHV